MPSFVRIASLVGVLAFTGTASAHIDMVSPKARELDQKQGPCGVSGSVRGKNITTVKAGSTLRVTWRETVNHPSHFRISFDADGDNDFIDPKSYEDRFTNASVLIDGISDAAGGLFAADVVLPDIACDNCTLQLVQVMYDKQPYAVGTNDLYYRCADLKLVKDTTGGTQPPPSDGPVDAGVPVTEADDAGTTDGIETDTNPATGDAPEPSGMEPAPSSQPAPQGQDSGVSGATCSVHGRSSSGGDLAFALASFLSALVLTLRAQRRGRFVLASAREQARTRQKR